MLPGINYKAEELGCLQELKRNAECRWGKSACKTLKPVIRLRRFEVRRVEAGWRCDVSF